jgi:hypothetical protein
MSSRRMAFFVFALTLLGAFAPQPPAAAAEVPMLRLLDASSVAVPRELAATTPGEAGWSMRRERPRGM